MFTSACAKLLASKWLAHNERRKTVLFIDISEYFLSEVCDVDVSFDALW